MKRLATAVLVLFALPSCDSGGKEYVKSMEDFAEKVCACKDTACATKASQEQADWLQKNAATAAKLDAKDAEKVTAAGTKMADCMTKLATGGK
ncbi:MAG: hypothetical protein K1X88_26730 [Nannocystaceae bacterium]|nr:hypothetical protein [Nannocystaceae bacterium]